MGKREAGKVASINYDNGHCDPPLVYLTIEWRGGGQGFGGLCLDERALRDYKQQLCDLFGVSRLESAVGKAVYALWSRDGLGEPIEGLECEGRRFTITGFRRKHWPDRIPGPDEAFLSALDAGYTDWEHVPL